MIQTFLAQEVVKLARIGPYGSGLFLIVTQGGIRDALYNWRLGLHL